MPGFDPNFNPDFNPDARAPEAKPTFNADFNPDFNPDAVAPAAAGANIDHPIPVNPYRRNVQVNPDPEAQKSAGTSVLASINKGIIRPAQEIVGAGLGVVEAAGLTLNDLVSPLVGTTTVDEAGRRAWKRWTKPVSKETLPAAADFMERQHQTDEYFSESIKKPKAITRPDGSTDWAALNPVENPWLYTNIVAENAPMLAVQMATGWRAYNSAILAGKSPEVAARVAAATSAKLEGTQIGADAYRSALEKGLGPAEAALAASAEAIPATFISQGLPGGKGLLAKLEAKGTTGLKRKLAEIAAEGTEGVFFKGAAKAAAKGGASGRAARLALGGITEAIEETGQGEVGMAVRRTYDPEAYKNANGERITNALGGLLLGAPMGAMVGPGATVESEHVENLRKVAEQTARVAEQHPLVESAQQDAQAAQALLSEAQADLGAGSAALQPQAPPAPDMAPQAPEAVVQDSLTPDPTVKESLTVPGDPRHESLPVEVDQRQGDRRQDPAFRKNVAEMSLEETQRVLLTSEKTGLPNRRAWDEAQKLAPKPVKASMDVDSLKWVNDSLGHGAGDELLAYMGDALRAAGLGEDAFHVSGDEFWAHSDSEEALAGAMAKADEYLKANPVVFNLPDGSTVSYTGGFSYGAGPELNAAESKLQAHKSERERTGQRAARGDQPPSVQYSHPARPERAPEVLGGEPGSVGELPGSDDQGQVPPEPEPQAQQVETPQPKEDPNAQADEILARMTPKDRAELDSLGAELASIVAKPLNKMNPKIRAKWNEKQDQIRGRMAELRQKYEGKGNPLDVPETKFGNIQEVKEGDTFTHEGREYRMHVTDDGQVKTRDLTLKGGLPIVRSWGTVAEFEKETGIKVGGQETEAKSGMGGADMSAQEQKELEARQMEAMRGLGTSIQTKRLLTFNKDNDPDGQRRAATLYSLVATQGLDLSREGGREILESIGGTVETRTPEPRSTREADWWTVHLPIQDGQTRTLNIQWMEPTPEAAAKHRPGQPSGGAGWSMHPDWGWKDPIIAPMGMSLVAGRHTKTQEPIWTVKMADRVSDEAFSALRSKAKDHEGRYSSYRGNGAIPGFIFKSEAQAKAFMGIKAEPAPESAEVAEKPANWHVTEDGGRKFAVGKEKHVIPPERSDLIARFDKAKDIHDRRQALVTEANIPDSAARNRRHEEIGAAFAAEKRTIAEALMPEDEPKAKGETLAKQVKNDTITEDGATNGPESKPDQGSEQTRDVPNERSGSGRAGVSEGTGSGGHPETGAGGGGKPSGRGATPEADRQEVVGNPEPSHGDGERAGVESGGGSAAGNPVHPGTRSGVAKPFRVDRDELKATNLSTEAGKKRAAKGNLEAIRTLKKLQAEGRLDQATPAEQNTLSKWVGWGALGKAVDYALARTFESYTERYGDDAGRYMGEEARKWGEEWLEIHKQIRDEIGEDGLRKAKASTINAHYTAPDVVSAMWDMVGRFGFKGGAVLEQSAGSGLFFGLMPEGLRGQSSLTGVELEPFTADLLKALYPEADIHKGGYQDAKIPSNSVDLIVGNVPFDESTRIEGMALHNFFFKRGIDQLKPGGIMAAITSTGTMDAMNNSHRKIIGESADLVGAIRLPNNAFSKNAGTQVTTDILVFRKRKGAQRFDGAQGWAGTVDLGIGDNREGQEVVVHMNEYWSRNPEQILGVPVVNTMYRDGGGQMSVEWKGTQDEFSRALQTAMARLPEGWAESGVPTRVLQESKEAHGPVGDGDVSLRGGIPMVHSEGTWLTPAQYGGAKSAKIIKEMNQSAQVYLDLIKTLDELRTKEGTDATDAELKPLRKELNRLYDAFVDRRGGKDKCFFHRTAVNKHVTDDANYFEAMALESEEKTRDPKTGEWKKAYVKADILSHRQNTKAELASSASNNEEAVLLSMMGKGRVDIDYMAGLLKQEPEDVKFQVKSEGLAYELPDGSFEPSWIYLSGEVRKKFNAAKKAAKENPGRFDRNVADLEKALPPEVPIQGMTVRMGATWVKPEVYQDFLRDVVGIDAKVGFDENLKQLIFDKNRMKVEAKEKYLKWVATLKGHQAAVSPEAIFASGLLWDGSHEATWRTDGKVYKDPVVTEVAMGKVREMRAAFQDWLRVEGNPHAQGVQTTFNELFRSVVKPKWPKLPNGTFPGQAKVFNGRPFAMEPFQQEGAFRATVQNTLLAHVVGSGKTITGGTAAYEMKRLGIANKPMIATMRSVVPGFAAQMRQLYPGARILVRPSNPNARTRKIFLTRLATMDFDMAILSHEDLSVIPDSPERVNAYINEQMDALEETMRGLKVDINSRDPLAQAIRARLQYVDNLREMVNGPSEEADSEDVGGKSTSKKAEKAKNRAAARMDDLLQRKTDKVMDWDGLGIDALIVDESHQFKRLDFFTQFTDTKGIDRDSSKRGLSLFLKTKAIHDKRGRVVLMTGTPITNTMAEIWTNLRYLRPDLLEGMGINQFDDFVKTFGDIYSQPESDITGAVKGVSRLRRFANMPELQAALFQAMHRVRRSEIKRSGVPKLAGGGIKTVIVKADARTDEFMNFIRSVYRAWMSSGKTKVETRFVPGTLYTRASQAALDLRLVDPEAKVSGGGKVEAMVKNALTHYQETQEQRGAQAIFCQLYQSPSNYGDYKVPESQRFNMFREIKRQLVAAGVPESEIVDQLPSGDKAREAVFEKVRTGEVRFVMGMVKTLGTGVNIQDRLIAMHILQLPLTPAELEQEIGRMERSGNMFDPVHVYTYAVEGGPDTFFAQVLANKQKFIDQVMDADILDHGDVEDLGGGGMSFEEMAAAFSGDNRIAEKMKVQAELNQLEGELEAFIQSQQQAQQQIHTYDNTDGYGSKAYLDRELDSVAAVEATTPKAIVKAILELAEKSTETRKTFDSESKKATEVKLVSGFAVKLPNGLHFSYTPRDEGKWELKWKDGDRTVSIRDGEVKSQLPGVFAQSIRRMEVVLPDIIHWRRDQAKNAAKDRAAADRIMEGEYKNAEALARARKKVADLEAAIAQGYTEGLRSDARGLLEATEQEGGATITEAVRDTLNEAEEAIRAGDELRKQMQAPDYAPDSANKSKATPEDFYIGAKNIVRSARKALGLPVEKEFAGGDPDDFRNWLFQGLSDEWYAKHGEVLQAERADSVQKIANEQWLDKMNEEEGRGIQELGGFTHPVGAFLSKLFGTRERPDSVSVPSLFDEVEQRWREAKKGAPASPMFAKAIDNLRKAKAAFTRHFDHIDPNESPLMAQVNDTLRQYEAGPAFAKAVAHDMVYEVTKDLGPKRIDLFTRVLVLRDILRNVDKGVDSGTEELPFGYRNAEEARVDLERYERVLKAPENAPIREALGKRTDMATDIVEKLVQHGILSEDRLDDVESYYHRQVMTYLNKRQVGSTGGDLRMGKKGFQLGRHGGAHDFNAAYEQAEAEWVADAMSLVVKKETLDRLERIADVAPQLRAQAKDLNREMFESQHPELGADEIDEMSAKEIETALGEQAVAWKDLMPEGYTIWQPTKGNHFYPALTLSERVLDQFLEGERGLVKEDFHQVLALGTKKKQWAIPTNLATQLDNFTDRDGSAFGNAWVGLQSSWKQWQLISPMRILRYSMNNMMGDLDIAMAYDPRIVTRHFARAAADMWSYQVNQTASPELRREIQNAIRAGVVESGITIAEIPDIDKTGAFRLLTSDRPNGNLVQKTWGGLKTFSTWRENILRLAAYRFFLEEIGKGRDLYAASNRSQIDALGNSKDKAAKLARELIGDYGNVSVAGQYVRTHMIPFYSWMEVNAPRYVRLLKNLPAERETTGGKRSAAGAVGRTIALKGPALALRMALMFGLIYLWNKLFFADDYEVLRRQKQFKHGIILGKRDDGSIRYIRTDLAVMDALEWFSAADLPRKVQGVARGEETWGDIAADAAKGPAEKIIKGWEPFSKTTFELVLGRSISFPTVWREGASLKPGGMAIRDKVGYVLKNVTPLDRLWNKITNKPERPGSLRSGLEDALLTYSVDPGEASYYLSRDIANDWGKKNLGKEEYSGAGNISEKGNALYYFKRASQWGDRERASYWFAEYLRLGGKARAIKGTIERGHPLGSIPPAKRGRFMASLNAKDKEIISDAISWYKRLNSGVKSKGSSTDGAEEKTGE